MRSLECVSPIPDHPALELSGEENALCAGDLHVGIEAELSAKGVHVPSQTKKMERELVSLSKGKQRLILLGDIKNSVPGSSHQEYAELPRFLFNLRRAFKQIDIVRGNHDTNIEDFLPSGVEVHPATGFVMDSFGFAHGHTWPSPEVMACKVLITAHNHPTVALKDSLGNITKEPCWVRFNLTEKAYQRYTEIPEEVIMMPSFNRTLGGSPVNAKGGKLLGPLFSEGIADLKKARVYTLDGIYLGKVRDLTVDSKRLRYEDKA